MIKYFSSNQSYVLILIPIFVLMNLLLNHYFPFIDPVEINQGNLWGIDFLLFSPFLSGLLAFAFICTNAVVINFVFNTIEFYERFNYLPSILYFLLVSFFPMSLYFNEALLGHFFFIFSFYQLLSIKQNDDARSASFLSGLFLGFSATFSIVYLCFIFLIWFGIFIIRPFKLREFLLPLFGLFIPLSWVYLIHPEFIDNLSNFGVYLHIKSISNYFILTVTTLLVFITLVGHKKMLERRFKSSIRFKKITAITILAFVFTLGLSLFLFLINKNAYYLFLSLLILPFILPYAFLNIRRKWLPNATFYILLLLTILKFFIV